MRRLHRPIRIRPTREHHCRFQLLILPRNFGHINTQRRGVKIKPRRRVSGKHLPQRPIQQGKKRPHQRGNSLLICLPPRRKHRLGQMLGATGYLIPQIFQQGRINKTKPLTLPQSTQCGRHQCHLIILHRSFPNQLHQSTHHRHLPMMHKLLRLRNEIPQPLLHCLMPKNSLAGVVDTGHPPRRGKEISRDFFSPTRAHTRARPRKTPKERREAGCVGLRPHTTATSRPEARSRTH